MLADSALHYQSTHTVPTLEPLSCADLGRHRVLRNSRPQAIVETDALPTTRMPADMRVKLRNQIHLFFHDLYTQEPSLTFERTRVAASAEMSVVRKSLSLDVTEALALHWPQSAFETCYASVRKLCFSAFIEQQTGADSDAVRDRVARLLASTEGTVTGSCFY